jgi:sugar phosphate permease
MPFLFVLYIIAYIDRINIGFAGLQMTGELHFSDAVFGFGSGVFFVGYALLGIPGAVLIEKWSARKAIAVTMLIWGFVASATGLIHSAPEFYAMRLILGITEAGFFPGVIGYLSHWYRTQDRGKAIAMFMAAIPVSQVIAAPLSAALMKINWLGLAGWRWLLILEGVPAVIAAVVSFVYLADRPRDAKWLATDEREWLAAELEREQARKTVGKRMSLWEALRHRDVLLLALAYFGGTCGTYGLSLWVPKMIQRLGHLTVVRSSLLSAIPALVGIPAMLLNGWHSDRVRERRWHASIPRFVAAFALAIMAVATVNVPVALVLLSLGSAGIVAGYPAIWAIPSSFLGTTAAAASIGLINSFGNLGGFAGPYLIGFFSSLTGAFSGGMWFIAAGAGVSAVLVLLVRQRVDRS